MRTRILPPEEWSRLDGSDLSGLLPFVDPSDMAVVVVEDDDGQIAAQWCAFQVTHFEGLWIAPKWRGNAGVVRALIRQAYAVPSARGEHWAITGAADTEAAGLDRRVDVLIRRLGGVPLPVKFYAVPIKEFRQCLLQ